MSLARIQQAVDAKKLDGTTFYRALRLGQDTGLIQGGIEGDLKRATALHMRLLSLHRQLFCEPSPAPTKWAMSRLGLCEPHVRLPILPLTEAGQALVEQALRDGGLLA